MSAWIVGKNQDCWHFEIEHYGSYGRFLLSEQNKISLNNLAQNVTKCIFFTMGFSECFWVQKDVYFRLKKDALRWIFSPKRCAQTLFWMQIGTCESFVMLKIWLFSLYLIHQWLIDVLNRLKTKCWTDEPWSNWNYLQKKSGAPVKHAMFVTAKCIFSLKSHHQSF